MGLKELTKDTSLLKGIVKTQAQSIVAMRKEILRLKEEIEDRKHSEVYHLWVVDSMIADHKKRIDPAKWAITEEGWCYVQGQSQIPPYLISKQFLVDISEMYPILFSDHEKPGH